MKSGKQRRQEIKAKHTVRKALARELARQLAAEPTIIPQGLSSGVGVDKTALAPDGSYSIPEFVQRSYYIDQPFICKDCGKAEVWAASQQKWWYEVAKGGVWTMARRCRPCRRKERERQEEARRVHLEGLARKHESQEPEADG